ncbi:MAG: transposase [Candidatus Baldrarchaeia archaeon]
MRDAERLNEALGKIAAKILNRKKISIAIDTTEIPYFGTRDEWVHYSPTRKCYVHRYVVAAAIDGPRKIPLSIRPISALDGHADAVEAALRAVERLGLEVEVVYLDRGFFSVEVMEVLTKRGVPFAIGARRTAGIKRVLEGFGGGGSHVIPYVVRSSGGRAGVEVDLVVYRRGERLMVVACRGVSPDVALGYWRRWGVETCNRMLKARRARTCSRSVALRWFLLLVSAMIYLSYVYLISRHVSVPAGHLRFLDALGLLLFGRVVGAGSAPARRFGFMRYCLGLRPPYRISVGPPVCVSPQGGRWRGWWNRP